MRYPSYPLIRPTYRPDQCIVPDVMARSFALIVALAVVACAPRQGDQPLALPPASPSLVPAAVTASAVTASSSPTPAPTVVAPAAPGPRAASTRPVRRGLGSRHDDHRVSERAPGDRARARRSVVLAGDPQRRISAVRRRRRGVVQPDLDRDDPRVLEEGSGRERPRVG